MTLEEIWAILNAQGDVVDIQGVSRDGPFTVTFSDGTTQEDVTLADLQAAAAELQGAPVSQQGLTLAEWMQAGYPASGWPGATRNVVPTNPATPQPSTVPVPNTPGSRSLGLEPTPVTDTDPTAKPWWWDDARDGNWEDQHWDAKYGAYPYKSSVATAAEVAAGEAEKGEMMVDGADPVAASAKIKAWEAKQPTEPKELAEGQEPTISRSGYDWLWNPETGKYDIPIGKTEDQEEKPTPLAADQLPSVSRGGYDYRWNPATGQYDIPVGVTAETPETPARRTLDQMLIDAVEAGDEAEQLRVLGIMDQVETLKNRPRPMNDQEIFAFLAPIAQNPQHFEELLRAFKQDMGTYVPQVTVGGAQDGTEGKVGIPSGNGQGVGPGSPQATIAAIQEEIRILGGQPQTPERDARLAELNEQLRIISVGPGIKAPAPTQEKSQAWLRSGSGHVIVDPNPGTSTPGRFYDSITGEWEPMDAYNERMARFRAAQAQAQGGITTPPQLSVPGTRTQEEEDWLKWFLEVKEQAAARGVGVPLAAAERYAQVAGKAPFNPAQFRAAQAQRPPQLTMAPAPLEENGVTNWDEFYRRGMPTVSPEVRAHFAGRGIGVPQVTTAQQQAEVKARQPVPQVGVGAGTATGQQGVKVGVPGIARQGAAFGGTPFFPIPMGTSRGSVLQEKFAREYNEARQQEFRRRKPPQLSFR